MRPPRLAPSLRAWRGRYGSRARSLPRPRGRPRRTEAREKLTVYVPPALALRLRWHCDYTGQELSGFVERAVVAALDAGADNDTRKIT